MRATGNMMEQVSSGEHLLGYNILGSYALMRAKKDPSLGVVLPKDYTLVLSRVAVHSKKAKNPNAAKLWLDYLLSKRGQKMIGNQAELFSIRTDVEGEDRRRRAHQAARVAPSSRSRSTPSSLAYLDQTKRLDSSSSGRRAAARAKVTRAPPQRTLARGSPCRRDHLARARSHRDPRAVARRSRRVALDLLPELAERAVLRRRADRFGLDALRVHLRRSATSGARVLNSVVHRDGMVVIAVPLGAALAFLMERTDLPGSAGSSR